MSESIEATVTSENSAPEVESSPTPTVESNSPENSAPEIGEDGKPVVATPAFIPNFKYRSNNAEREIDEMFRPLIKDADTEKKIKDLLTKYDGFDSIKAHKEAIQSRYDKINSDHSRLANTVNTLDGYIQGKTFEDKDYKTFFDSLKIPEEDILRYAYERLKYQEASPEQRSMIDRQYQMRSQNYSLSHQVREQSQMVANLASQQAEADLGMVLQNPEITSARTEYDQRMGREGAFQKALIDRGAYYEKVENRSPSALELAREIMQVAGLTGRQNIPAAQTPNASSMQPAGAASPAPKPVITNVVGRGTSPVQKQMNSVEDLIKHRKQLLNEE